MGRLAMNYLLVLHGHPPIIIHEALEAWDARQELEPLLTFLRAQTEKTWAKQMNGRKSKRTTAYDKKRAN